MYNKVILIGNVGGNPQVKTLENGKVANFSLATSEKWYDKENQVQERTQWHNIVCYRNLAELTDNYISKGVRLMVEGKIIYREWEDENKQKRYSTDIVADVIKLLSSKESKEPEKNNTPKISYKTPTAAADVTSSRNKTDEIPF